MRMMFIFAMLVSALPSVALAQSNSTTNSLPPPSFPPPPSDAILRNQLPVVIDSSRIPGLEDGDVMRNAHARVGGALARATRAGQPWQAVNPFAPPEFGQWYENVSVNPHTHQPEGIVLVSFRIGSPPRGVR